MCEYKKTTLPQCLWVYARAAEMEIYGSVREKQRYFQKTAIKTRIATECANTHF